ncbi:hypothetical protein C1H46_008638 [Malus baccata]|uniref:Uncharacterized protein n=1 Tax=Malus baccata TaxID=106549 RepID=A0A540N3U7_MALBA|nr:hypothetical protein C1H46_008638 [Malus baccata]
MSSMYPHTRAVLYALKEKRIDLAIPSVNCAPKVSKMGVTSILVFNGVNVAALRQVLTNYAENVNTYERNMQKWCTMYSKSSSSSEKNEKE